MNAGNKNNCAVRLWMREFADPVVISVVLKDISSVNVQMSGSVQAPTL